MFITFVKGQISPALAYDTKEQLLSALEDDLKFEVLSQKEFTDSVILDTEAIDYTYSPCHADYYINITDYTSNGEELSVYSHDEMAGRSFDNEEFVGVYKDGEYAIFAGNKLEFSE
jgi:hypothetical protein